MLFVSSRAGYSAFVPAPLVGVERSFVSSTAGSSAFVPSPLVGVACCSYRAGLATRHSSPPRWSGWTQLGDVSKKTLDELQEYLNKNPPEAHVILEALARGYIRTFHPQEAMHCLGLWLERQPNDRAALTLQAGLL